jgi:hypothetical protein
MSAAPNDYVPQNEVARVTEPSDDAFRTMIAAGRWPDRNVKVRFRCQGEDHAVTLTRDGRLHFHHHDDSAVLAAAGELLATLKGDKGIKCKIKCAQLLMAWRNHTTNHWISRDELPGVLVQPRTTAQRYGDNRRAFRDREDRQDPLQLPFLDRLDRQLRRTATRTLYRFYAHVHLRIGSRLELEVNSCKGIGVTLKRDWLWRVAHRGLTALPEQDNENGKHNGIFVLDVIKEIAPGRVHVWAIACPGPERSVLNMQDAVAQRVNEQWQVTWGAP